MSNRPINIAIRAKNETQSGIQSAIGSLKSLDNQIGSVSKTFKALGEMAVFAAITEGIKKAIDAGIECVAAYGEVQRTMIQLQTAVGGSSERFQRLTNLIDDMAGRTLESKDSVEKLVAELASLGKSDSDIERITEATVALSNVTGDSLESAFTKINATFTGTTGKLEKLIPELGNLTSEQLKAGDAVDLLNSKFGAISDAMANGVSQNLNNLTKSWDDFKEAVGKSLEPLTNALTSSIKAIIDNWTAAITKTNEYYENKKKQASADAVESAEGSLGLAQGELSRLQAAYEARRKTGHLTSSEDYARANPGSSARDYIVALESLNSIFHSQFTEATFAVQKAEAALTAAKAAAGKTTSPSGSTPSSGSTPLGSSTTTPGVKNASWADVKADSTPWAIAAKGLEDAAKSMDAVNLELERQKYDHPYDTSGATTSYSDGSGSGKSSGSFFGDLFKQLDFSGITSAFSPLTDILSPIINNLGSFNIALAVLQPIMEGFTNAIGPAISQFIAPLMNALKNVGGMLANAILPVLEALTPFINLISQMLMTVLTPVINLIAASLSPIAAILELLTPIIKACAIAIEILTAPVRWIADLFTWVGGVLQTFVYNILHPFNGRGYSSFSSDAFSGLNDRIAAITNAGQTDLTPGSATTPYSGGGSTPSYTGPENLYVNVYQYGVYTDMEQVKKETTQAVFTALTEAQALG